MSIYLVAEDAIVEAQDLLFREDGIAAEGAAVAAAAYVQSHPGVFAGRSVAIVVSGAAG